MKSINLKNACQIVSDIAAAKARIAHIKDLLFLSNLSEAGRAANESSLEKYEAELQTAEQALSEDKGYQALTAALADVQLKSRIRTVEAFDVVSHLNAVYDYLGISKKALDGVSVRADLNAQTFPNAYKYRPESTIFTAEYKAGSWRVTDIRRDTTVQRVNGTTITHTDASKAALLSRLSEM